MEKLKQLEKFAVDHLLAALKTCPDTDGRFRCVVTTFIGEKPTPVLLVGNAHRRYQDGYVIAVSNPSEQLPSMISAGCAYHSKHLKKIVTGRCDAMVGLNVLAGGAEPLVCRYTRYKAQKPRSAVVSV